MVVILSAKKQAMRWFIHRLLLFKTFIGGFLVFSQEVIYRKILSENHIPPINWAYNLSRGRQLLMISMDHYSTCYSNEWHSVWIFNLFTCLWIWLVAVLPIVFLLMLCFLSVLYIVHHSWDHHHYVDIKCQAVPKPPPSRIWVNLCGLKYHTTSNEQPLFTIGQKLYNHCLAWDISVVGRYRI